MPEPAKRDIPLSEIRSVSIPKWVFCEVDGCGWCTPNTRGSFTRYCQHVGFDHTAEEWESKTLWFDGTGDADR